MSENRVKINPKDVLALLADGKTREEVREHYNLSKGDLKKVFQHPELKGRKTKKAPGFVFEDDAPSNISNTEIETTTNEVSNVDATIADDVQEENVVDVSETTTSKWEN